MEKIVSVYATVTIANVSGTWLANKAQSPEVLLYKEYINGYAG